MPRALHSAARSIQPSISRINSKCCCHLLREGCRPEAKMSRSAPKPGIIRDASSKLRIWRPTVGKNTTTKLTEATTNKDQPEVTIGLMHSARKRPSRPSDHPASAMPPPTKTIPAVSRQPAPADPYRQPPNFTSVQAHLPGPRRAPPPSRPSGPPATPPNRLRAGRQRTARRGPRRQHRALEAAQLHRHPAGTAFAATQNQATSATKKQATFAT